MMRIVCGFPWTLDGRWVVLGDWHGAERIIYDPNNAHGCKDVALEGPPSWASLSDIRDCVDFLKEKTCLSTAS